MRGIPRTIYLLNIYIVMEHYFIVYIYIQTFHYIYDYPSTHIERNFMSYIDIYIKRDSIYNDGALFYIYTYIWRKQLHIYI